MHPLKFEYLQLTGKTDDENLLYSCYADLVVRLFCVVHKPHLLMSNTKPVVAAQCRSVKDELSFNTSFVWNWKKFEEATQIM